MIPRKKSEGLSTGTSHHKRSRLSTMVLVRGGRSLAEFYPLCESRGIDAKTTRQQRCVTDVGTVLKLYQALSVHRYAGRTSLLIS